jgi:ABC-2 type transport system permease protein
MTQLIAAELRKLFTTRMWWWILLISVAWTILYSALAIGLNKHSGRLTPPLSSAAGQHALFAIGAGGAGPLAAILGAAGTAGEYRHRTAAVTFLATPRRARVIAAKLVTYLAAGIGYALVCVVAEVAMALPWLASKGIPVPLTGHGNLAVLGAVLVSAGLFGMTGAGLGALLGAEITTIAGLLLYLYVAEPAVSHIAAFRSWTVYLPGVAADGLTQAVQTGVSLLPPGPGGLVFAAWAAAIALAGIAVTVRRDIT